jgi:Rrf2 family protein
MCFNDEPMVNILKLTQGSVIGLHVTLLLSKGSGQPIATEAAAKELGVSAAHLSKVLQHLGRAGILRAVRGPKGGYIPGRPLSEIRLRDIVEAVEGPIKLKNCLFPTPRCDNGGCMLGDLLESVNSQVLEHFEKRLSDI